MGYSSMGISAIKAISTQGKVISRAPAVRSVASEFLKPSTLKTASMQSKVIFKPSAELHKLMKTNTKRMRRFNIFNQPITEVKVEPKKQFFKKAYVAFKRILFYPLNKYFAKKIPAETKALLSDVIHLPREKFGQAFYTKLVKAHGLEGVAPKELQISSLLGFKRGPILCGGYGKVTNEILFDRKFVTASRASQAAMVRHELEHLKQTDLIIRTYGLDRYIEALEVEQKKKFLASEIDDIKEAFKCFADRPKIDLNSELGKKAAQYLEGAENYTNIFSGCKNFLKYRRNILEKEAYRVGDNIGCKVSILESLNLKSL